MRWSSATASPRSSLRRSGLIIVFSMLAFGLGAVALLIVPPVWRHYTYVTTEALVTGHEVRCQYKVPRLSKRGQTIATELIACREAERLAAEHGHPLSQIRRVATIDVAFGPAQEIRSSFELPEAAAIDIVVGQRLAIQHHAEQRHVVQRFADRPFAIVAHKRYSGAAANTSGEQKRLQSGKPGEPRGWIEIVARILAWIIVASMGVAILWLIWGAWRLVSRLVSGRVVSGQPATIPVASRQSGASRAPHLNGSGQRARAPRVIAVSRPGR